MKRLSELRKLRNLKQADIANYLGITRPAYTNYETGAREPDNNTLSKLAEFYNVSVDYLLEREIKNTIPKREIVKLPVYGMVAAGAPILTVEDILDYIEIDKEDINDGDYIALQVKGDSMTPDIKNNDIVVVRRQPDVDSGQIAVIIVNGDEATVKKVNKHKDGISLVANNPNYEPMFFSRKEIDDLPVVVYGRVVELRRKF